METIGNRLKTYFSNLGKAGVKPEDLKAFEDANQIVLPDDFKEYLLNVNGTSQMDSKMILFHALKDMKVLPQIKEAVATPRCLVFADYFVWEFGLGIDVTNGASSHSVWMVDRTPTKKNASSFSEFVDIYFKIDHGADLYNVNI